MVAMAQQALETFDNRLSYSQYTEMETPVRIVLRSASGAPTVMGVMSYVM